MVERTWLCRDDLDRERLIDMERHLRPVRAITVLLIAASTAAVTGWVGLDALLLVLAGSLLATAMFVVADRSIEHADRPEYVMFAAWIGTVGLMAVCIGLTGGAHSPGLAWIAIPVVTLGARFSLRGVIAGAAIAVALLLAALAVVDPGDIPRHPAQLIAVVMLIVSIAVLSTASMRSDLRLRGESVIDPLTGMLNRKALENRVGEVSEQSHLTGDPVGLIIGDIDKFKMVNDALGHSTGDAVLKDVASVLRKHLRAFDPAYRIGGEEFLVLLPGADLRRATEIAQTLRKAVASGGLADGAPLTMSFGVSASALGSSFDYEQVFKMADAALYEAKASGRNLVCDRSAEAPPKPPRDLAPGPPLTRAVNEGPARIPGS